MLILYLQCVIFFLITNFFRKYICLIKTRTMVEYEAETLTKTKSFLIK